MSASGHNSSFKPPHAGPVARAGRRYAWGPSGDHRLVRHQPLCDCEPPAWALDLFLVTVADADAEGLSFYSDASLGRHYPHLDAVTLAKARQQLVSADVVAYGSPLPRFSDWTPLRPRPWLAPANSVAPATSLAPFSVAADLPYDRLPHLPTDPSVLRA